MVLVLRFGIHHFQDGINAPAILDPSAGPVEATSGSTFTNTGEIASLQYDLPPATIGLQFTFAVVEAQDLVVAADGTDVLQVMEVASGLSMTSNTPGSVVTLTCIEAGTWMATSVVGPWDVTT